MMILYWRIMVRRGGRGLILIRMLIDILFFGGRVRSGFRKRTLAQHGVLLGLVMIWHLHLKEYGT
jgi:hypothetical protein